MSDITKREEEIAELREQKALTFKAIAERYQISPNRASQIYRSVQRKRREERRRELYREENKKTVSVPMTLGELEVLRRILLAFSSWKLDNETHTIGKWCEFLSDTDYTTAESLNARCGRIEQEERNS